MSIRLALTIAIAAAATTATGQTYTIGNQSFDGAVCIGDGCTSSETFPHDAELKLKELDPRLVFEDTTTNPSIATRDWALTANQLSGPLEYFAVTDLEGGDNNHVLLIEGGAPAESLRIAANGNVGLGTSLPGSDLHIVSYLAPTIRFEQDATSYPPYVWTMNGRDTGFYISDLTNPAIPFVVLAGTPTYMMQIQPAGVGIGGGFWTAENTLHVRRDDGTAQVKVQEASATTSPRTLLNLQNNGRPEIVMGNTGTGGEWSFGAGTNFILKQGPVGSLSSAKTTAFQIDPAGNATLAGSLTTGGTTCGGGCDAVFAPDYELPDIAERAAQMYRLGHLPNMGPMPENQPFNLTDKFGRLLNEVEHAHIYIARLERQNADLAARLAAVEARLAQ